MKIGLKSLIRPGLLLLITSSAILILSQPNQTQAQRPQPQVVPRPTATTSATTSAPEQTPITTPNQETGSRRPTPATITPRPQPTIIPEKPGTDLEVFDVTGDGIVSLADAAKLLKNCQACFDLNNDQNVNDFDLKLLESFLGTNKGSRNFNPDADFNSDGTINRQDAELLRAKFGQVAKTQSTSVNFEELFYGYVDRELLIFFKPQVTEAEINKILKDNHLELKKKTPGQTKTLYTVKTYSPFLSRQIEKLKAEPKIEIVSKNNTGSLNTHQPVDDNFLIQNLHYPSQYHLAKYFAQFHPPPDVLLPNQWNLSAINLPQGWEESRGLPRIQIAVLDTGVDTSHPDLLGKIDFPGFNAIDGTGDVTDNVDHGTRVAGIAAAGTFNGKGIAGVGWNVKILPIKVTDQVFFCCPANAVFAGIQEAINRGAEVINMSFGSVPNPTDDFAILDAYFRNITLVASAGNENKNRVGYPASHPNVIGVGAVTSSLTRDPISNFGTGLDVVAPGGVYSTGAGGTYPQFEHTSAAAAHVSGLAGLYYSSAFGEFQTPAVFSSRLTATSRDLGPAGVDSEYGHGIPQAKRLLAQWNCQRADFNKDGRVDVIDKQMISFRFGAVYGSSFLYHPVFDVIGSGNPALTFSQIAGDWDIDILDLQYVFGRSLFVCLY